MNILCITDMIPGHPNDSMNEDMFGKSLKRFGSVDIVYFDRADGPAHWTGDRILLPYRTRWIGLFAELKPLIGDKCYDIVVVHDMFEPVRQAVEARAEWGFKIGFWESISYAEIELVEKSMRAGWRWWRHLMLRHKFSRRMREEDALLEKTDFYLPITDTFKTVFRPGLTAATLALPMGVDTEAHRPSDTGPQAGPVRFVYIGTTHPLRKLDTVVEGFRRSGADFRFDIYSKSPEAEVKTLLPAGDARFAFKGSLERRELLRILPGYDVGISLIPETKLYRISSPTKTMEYYATGLPVIMTPLPEHRSLFDDDAGYYAQFTPEAIAAKVAEIAGLPRQRIRDAGLIGRKVVEEKRSYPKLAERLAAFLESLPAKTRRSAEPRQ